MSSDGTRITLLGLTDDEVLPVDSIVNFTKDLGSDHLERCDTRIITKASALNHLSVESSSVDMVVSISKSLKFPGEELLGEVSRILKPGGTIFICLNESGGGVDKATSALQRKLLLAGFLEAQSLNPNADGLSRLNFSMGVKGKKPLWKLGSSFAIKKPEKSPLKIELDDESDLIDEDSLLTEEDLKKPQIAVVGDCEAGATRKACKNCTCGRAEAEKVEKLELTSDQVNNPQSACGSCGLGDAFRCSTCPYRGLPPFKLGDKVTLPQNFLAADI